MNKRRLVETLNFLKRFTYYTLLYFTLLATDIFVSAHFFSPFGLVADVDEAWFTSRLHFIRQSNCASKQAVARHHLAYNARHYGTAVNSNANLRNKENFFLLFTSALVESTTKEFLKA